MTAFAWNSDLCSKGTDLHIHTNMSDGTLSPEEVVLWAKRRGLTKIAITDHDSAQGIERGRKAAEEAGIEFIPGIEIATDFFAADLSVQEGTVKADLSIQTEKSKAELHTQAEKSKTGLHILGYGIDANNSELQELCRSLAEWRRDRNKKLLETLAEEGYPIPKGEINNDYIGKPQMARAMVRLGYINEVKEAFESIFSKESMRIIPKQKVNTEEAIRIINNAGGVSVFAHPGSVRHIGERETEGFFNTIDIICERLSSHGLGGLECCYPKHSADEEARFMKIAAKHGLFVTRGSDYHGPEH